jgi:hypothetical protein
MPAMLVRKLDGPAPGTSAPRIEAARETAAAVERVEQRLAELERDIAAVERETVAADKERRAAGALHIDLCMWPSFTEGQGRARRHYAASTEHRQILDQLPVLRALAADAAAQAAPLSPTALRRLQQLVADIAADDELRRAGIDASLLLPTPAGRDHLTSLARSYNIEG